MKSVSELVYIKVKDLAAKVRVGCTPKERRKPQPVFISFSYCYAVQKAVVSDQLSDALDYQKISQKILKTIEKREYALIETLCKSVLDIILMYRGIQKATVKIKKPKALDQAKYVFAKMKFRIK